MVFQMIMFHFSFGFDQHLCGPSGFTSEGRLAFLALQVSSLPESFFPESSLALQVSLHESFSIHNPHLFHIPSIFT